MRFPRFLGSRLESAFSGHPAVFLEGPRQAGKSTLALAVAKALDMPYYTLDDLDLLAAVRSGPRGFLEQVGERAVLDEVQRAPGLLLALKPRLTATAGRGATCLRALPRCSPCPG